MIRRVWLEWAPYAAMELVGGWADARRTVRPPMAEARRVGPRPYVVGYVARMMIRGRS